MGYSQLNDEQFDALREVSSIGMGHAATALSQLVGKMVLLTVPKVHVTEISRIAEIFGSVDQLVVSSYLQMLGDARGTIVMVFPWENALDMLENLLERPKSTESLFTELETSALKEVGNILASAFLNALGNLLGMTLIPSTPAIACDNLAKVIDHVLMERGGVGEVSLILETAFSGEDGNVTGHFLLFPDPGALQIILTALGL